MGCDFTVTVYDEVRGMEFEKVFGTRTVPVISPIPEWAKLPGFEEAKAVYDLDLQRISADQRERLVTHIAEKFGLEPSAVEADLDEVGMPILADECVASLGDIRKFL